MVYNIQTASLSPQREAMRVSWFATAGAFEHDVTGRAADDPALTADNDWVAPTTAGPVHLWLVLRDSRGGVDFAEYELDVSQLTQAHRVAARGVLPDFGRVSAKSRPRHLDVTRRRYPPTANDWNEGHGTPGACRRG